MTIRNRITRLFSVLLTVTLALFTAIVYLLSADYRSDEYHKRLEDQAYFAAELFFHAQGLKPEALQELYERQYTRLTDEDLTIMDAGGKVVFESGVHTAKLTPEQLRSVIHGKVVRQELPDQKELAAVRVFENEQNYAVLVAAYDKYGRTKLDFLLKICLAFTVVGAVLSLAGGYWFAGRALTPIKDIIKQVNGITSQNLNTRVLTQSTKDEIAELAYNFNQMLAGLEEGFILNKSFVQNASHELRTPLTVLRGQVEVALNNQRLDEASRALLQSLLEDIAQLTQLTNGLLELSQLSSSQYQPRFDLCRLDETLWESVESLAHTKPKYQVTVNYKPEAADTELTIMGNAQWLQNAYKNLMVNACKFSADHSVDVSIGKEGIYSSIAFSDHGPGIGADEQSKIFEPFYRSDRTMHIKGHGIGLSITKKIIELHGGHITLSSQVGQGSTFTIWLPLVP